jgi:hypothetical protein
MSQGLIRTRSDLLAAQKLGVLFPETNPFTGQDPFPLVFKHFELDKQVICPEMGPCFLVFIVTF